MDDLREKIENLKRALDNIRESKRQLQKVRGRNIKMRIWQSLLRGRITRIAASIFFVLGAIGAIGPIIELLKLVGWLK
jgi:predicted RNA-binding protein with EMAP domain